MQDIRQKRSFTGSGRTEILPSFPVLCEALVQMNWLHRTKAKREPHRKEAMLCEERLGADARRPCPTVPPRWAFRVLRLDLAANRFEPAHQVVQRHDAVEHRLGTC